MSRNSQNAALSNDFNWDLYADGWDGVTQKANKKIRKGKKRAGDIIYSHEKYAQDLYNRMSKINVMNVKDSKKGDNLPISDLHVVDDNTLSATVGYGAGTVLIDLDKENKFYEQFGIDDKKLDKQGFIDGLKNDPNFKSKLLSLNLTTKLGTDMNKGSMWDGYVDKLTAEFKQQITAQDKAYFAEVLNVTTGGFNVLISGTIKGFMPGSMASSNKITDYESYVGRTIEVMIESWTPKRGFLVSRKKYINKAKPLYIEPIAKALEKEPEKLYKGKITGHTPFGVFVELDEFITGMLHKSLVSDDLRMRMRAGEIETGNEIDVYVARIDNTNRVILSDVHPSERAEVEERRRLEDEAEKSEYMASKNSEKKQKNRKTNLKTNATANG